MNLNRLMKLFHRGFKAKRRRRTFWSCRHHHRSFPMTRNRITYVVCLDCGAEFSYDWSTMREGRA